MFRGRIVSLLVVAALLVGATTASAQDEKMWGLGVDLQNQGFLMMSWVNTLESAVGGQADPPSPISNTMTTHLTPCFMITLRPTSNWFIEPMIGFHRMAGKNTFTDPADATLNSENELTATELKLGLSAIYSIDPSMWCSPYVRGIFGWHSLTANEKETTGGGYGPTAGTDETEAKANAFQFAAALGGMVGWNDCLFLTVEARLLWALVGDTEFTFSGPNIGSQTDMNETDGNVFWTDMSVGLRLLFF